MHVSVYVCARACVYAHLTLFPSMMTANTAVVMVLSWQMMLNVAASRF
jgi:hypothetical protein